MASKRTQCEEGRKPSYHLQSLLEHVSLFQAKQRKVNKGATNSVGIEEEMLQMMIEANRNINCKEQEGQCQ